MDHYHHTFTQAIKKLGSDPDLFTRRDFAEQLKKFGPWAVIGSVNLTVFTLANNSSIRDVNEFCEMVRNGEETSLFLGFDEATNLIYSQRMRDNICDMYDLGYYVKSN